MTRLARPSPKIAVVACNQLDLHLATEFYKLGVLEAVGILDWVAPETTHHPQFGVPICGIADILSRPDITALAITAPTSQHIGFVHEALKTGKHVFIKFPQFDNTDNITALHDIAGQKGVIVMVPSPPSPHHALTALAEICRSDRLGELRHVHSHRINPQAGGGEADILRGLHLDISAILALLNDDIEWVSAVGQKNFPRALGDAMTVYITARSGKTASLHVSCLPGRIEHRLVAVGVSGSAVFDDNCDGSRKLCIYSHQGDLPTVEDIELAPLVVDASMRQNCIHFLDMITQSPPLRTTDTNDLRLLQILDAVQHSLESGIRTKLYTAPPHSVGATIHPTAVVDSPVKIGEGTRIWHFSHVLKNSRIGRDCNIGQNVMIGPDVTIGDRCKIQNNVSVYPGVTLEDGVFCGPSMVFTNVANPRAEIERKHEYRPTTVKRGATIGANATVVCGHDIGRFALIGAGAVVTRDVPDFALMVGNPAHRLGWVCACGEQLPRGAWTESICSACGKTYHRDGDVVRETGA